MNPLNERSVWLIIGLIALGTYLIRLSFIQLMGDNRVPSILSRLLRFIPPAALSALILPAVLIRQGHWDVNLSNGRIVALAVAALLALIWKNTVLTIASGLIVLWLYQTWICPPA